MRNYAKTAVLLAGLAGLILFIGSFWGGPGLVIAVVISFLLVGGSYWFSDKLAIKSAKAQEVPSHKLPEYHAAVKEIAQLSDIPSPKIYVSPDRQPNAFATGRNPANAAVCITEGMIQELEWYEIRGVIAHEMAHIKNRDILIGSVAAAVATAITFAARMAQWALIFGGRSDDGDRNILTELALIILAPIAAFMIQMAISRSREYQADRTAARLIGDGEPLARALEKLDKASRHIPSLADANQAQMYIVNPLAGRKMNFRSLFSTHPPLAERVKRLRDGSWMNA